MMSFLCGWRPCGLLSHGASIRAAISGTGSMGTRFCAPRRIRLAAKQIGSVDLDGVPSDLYRTTSNEDESDRSLKAETSLWWNSWTISVGAVLLTLAAWQLLSRADPSVSFTIIIWSWWLLCIYLYPWDYEKKLRERRRIEAEGVDDPYGENVN